MSSDVLSLNAWNLLDLALIFGIVPGVAVVCRRLRQPVVVGELAVSLALGPSFLGADGGVTARLFPETVRPALEAIAQVGVVLFVFFTALEMDTGAIRRAGRRTVATVLGGTVPPLLVGAAFGLAVLTAPGPGSTGQGVPKIYSAIFLGVALSVTAFPVLARVLEERGQRQSPLGIQALATAGLVDLAAWLAITALIATGPIGGEPLVTVVGLLSIVVVTRYVAGPLLAWLLGVGGDQSWLTPALVAYALVSATAADAFGTEAILGAVLAGVALPTRVLERDGGVAIERVGQLAGLLVPVFFIVVGLNVDLRSIGASGWFFFLGALVIAVVTKFGGTYATARGTGMPRNESALLGVLMNMRGLTEVVVVQAGVSAGLLPQAFGTALILVALVTTAMSAPLLHVLSGPAAEPRRPAPNPMAARGAVSPQ